MAIKKDIVTKTGSVAGYWKIKGRNINDMENQTVVFLNGYRNRNHRDLYPDYPEETKIISLNAIFSSDGTRKEIYTEICKSPEFSGGEEV